jgi:hypothetical protein
MLRIPQPILIAGLAVTLCAAVPAAATPLTLTDIDYGPNTTKNPLNSNGDLITGFSTSASSVSSVQGVTRTANVTTVVDADADGDNIRNLWGSSSSSTEVDGGDALLGLTAVTGLLELTTGDFFFGTALQGAAGQANDIFILDFGGEDAYTVTPLDDSGAVIGGGFTFTPTDAIGDPTASIVADDSGNYENVTGTVGAGLNGFAFDVEDFAGLTGLVEGVRITPGSGASTPDPTVIGFNTAAIPEPASVALLAAGGLMLLPRRRR